MGQDYNGIQEGTMRPELKETITNLGLEYRLMTQYTSFVAVEEMIVTDGGTPRRIDVPVEVPEGVSREGVFGEKDSAASGQLQRRYSYVAALNMSPGAQPSPGYSGTGSKAKRARPIGRSSGAGRGVEGAIVANSPPSATVTVAADEAPPPKASPEEEKQQLLLTKLHPSLRAVVERLNKKAAAGADEVKFVRGDKAEVQIWLTDKSADALTKLKELGFEILLNPKSAQLVIGRLPIENIQKLAELKFVRYVAPQNIH